MKIDNWKEVKIIDLFEANVSKKELGKGVFPEVTGQTKNNGIRGNVGKYNQENIFTIASVGAYCGTAFWHPYKFWLSNNVQGYNPKFKISDNIALFICTVLTKTLRKKFSYGKPASIERVMQESIFLPHNDKGEIDWEWIEEFMEKLDEKVKEDIANEPKFKSGPVDINNWKEFKLIDLFDISKGSGKIEKTGDYPAISASGVNRGKAGMSESFTHENAFSFSSVGQPGIVFWHPYKFKALNNMGVLSPKFKISDEVGVFIELVITKSLTPKYNYGKPLSISRLQEESVFLPEKDGKPDVEFMEKFIKELKE